jgi:distribution and morphology protein 34
LDVGEPARVPEQTTEAALAPSPLLAEPPKLSKAKSKAKISTPPTTEKPEEKSRPPLSTNRLRPAAQATSPLLRSLSLDKISSMSSTSKNPISPHSYTESISSGGILEQAWMLKMAQEIAKRVQEEKDKEAARDRDPAGPPGSSSKRGIWAGEEDMDAPPAYVA